MKTMQQLRDNKNLSYEDLASVKHDLKIEIDKQQVIVLDSAKRLIPFSKNASNLLFRNSSFSPLSLLTISRRKGRNISLLQGILIGYKLMRNIRRLLRR